MPIAKLENVFFGMILFEKESFSLVDWRKNESRLRLFSGLFFIALSLYMLLIIL